jgi:uncharacterized protein (TIGR00266 family)
MLYMEDGITFETKMGDGSKPDQGFLGKLFSAGQRMLTGESVFMTHFKNNGQGKKRVAFAAPYPGKIVPVNMGDVPGGELLCQKDAFLCAALGTEISIAFTKKFGAGFFGGQGFILQKLRGDGMVFLHAGGAIIEKRLDNQKMSIDTGCIVAFEPCIQYDIERAGNLKSMFLGGEGLFLATLCGTGRIWLQSLPLSSLAQRIIAFMPKSSS